MPLLINLFEKFQHSGSTAPDAGWCVVHWTMGFVEGAIATIVVAVGLKRRSDRRRIERGR